MSEHPDQHEVLSSRAAESSPLDPYVEQVARWFASTPGGFPANGLASAIATQFGWPTPFAEAILASVNGRRLLRVDEISSRPMRLTLSRRGDAWLRGLNQSD